VDIFECATKFSLIIQDQKWLIFGKYHNYAFLCFSALFCTFLRKTGTLIDKI